MEQGLVRTSATRRSTPLALTLAEASIPRVARLSVRKAGLQSLSLTFREERPHATERTVPPHLHRVLSPHLSDYPSVSFSGLLQSSRFLPWSIASSSFSQAQCVTQKCGPRVQLRIIRGASASAGPLDWNSCSRLLLDSTVGEKAPWYESPRRKDLSHWVPS